MSHDGLTESPAGKWTRAEDYVAAMARTRGFRRQHRAEARSEPESPRAMLSTVPFVALIAVLLVLAVCISLVANPATQPEQKAPQAAERERGVAAKGWLQEAEKEFHK